MATTAEPLENTAPVKAFPEEGGPLDAHLGQISGSYDKRWFRSPTVIIALDVLAITLVLFAREGRTAPAVGYAVGLPLWLAATGRYRQRLRPSVQVDVVPLLGALSAPMLLLAWLPGPDAGRLLRDTPVLAAAVLLARGVGYGAQYLAKTRGDTNEPTLIVGAGVLGCRVAEALLAHKEYGLKPVGFVDGFPDAPHLPLPIVGDIDTFDAAVRRTGASRVIIAFGANRESEIVEVFRATLSSHVEIHIIPRLFELGFTPEGPDTDRGWGLPIQHARRVALRTPAWRTKRLVDILVSGLLLLLTSPILAATALLVRLTSRGPVLFRQDRVGQRGHVVQILKFRSMRINAESETRWGESRDERITPLGRLLRITDIDELPQLFNVLRGDMSLVGPRPERPHFASQFDQQVIRYHDRLRVPCGLTGWAQVHGLRGDTSIEERARFDNYYIEHWSLWFDIVILARTVRHVAIRVLASALRHKRK
jgi:exopolysaccharide biosynthesis polyprenyl glycosylphosphotransferase